MRIKLAKQTISDAFKEKEFREKTTTMEHS
jgi:hypothetical protein